MRYREGDLVRVVGNRFARNLVIGSLGKIVSVDLDDRTLPYLIQIDPHPHKHYWVCESDLSPAKEDLFTKLYLTLKG